MMRIDLCFFFLILSMTFSQRSLADFNIVGGNPVTADQQPWVVRVKSTKSEYVCTGTIIGSRWVLTAAHCAPTADLPLSTFIVEGGGSGKVADLKRISMVKNFFVHPNYPQRKKADWDVGIIELEENIDFSSELAPIKMKDIKDVTIFKGDTVTISGWGFLDNSGTRPTELTSITVPVYRAHEAGSLAASQLFGTDYSRKEFLVTVTKGETTCYGDSGTGLVMNDGGENFLVATLSMGDNCHGFSLSPVLTHVLPFITEVTGIEPLSARE